MRAHETERLAKAETRLEHIEARLDELHADVKAIGAGLDKIDDAFLRQRGFIAGITAAATVIWTAGALVVSYFVRELR